MIKFKVDSPEQTEKLGEELAPDLKAGDVILLDGDLGAGKTTFTKGLGKGLGIKRNIKSPTFTIIREYKNGRLPLYHMDVYRLEEGGADELGLNEYFNGDGVSVVEWSKFAEDELPDDYLRIKFTRNDELGDNDRTIEMTASGGHFNAILKSGDLNLGR
ncbi:tRNA (adenosine(37)-N6)-threonylcarbamoyltransferase complex ATPase subunit type 1 TsaE [Fructilactobacillus fructivorans]|uniref:tRNA threonylcarbamoyladenosine biosynthesis protein TsaE n=1 Tax=Fructilactobacillus fructivorans TaxID=1614 RepID=A0A0C1PLM5_9LACO|nr:tRNA (adenosine(37)-N6)-threonylcarbamoyltransferase complex ATPase subunit type 1 TsaE [Fructilactobacillus fructivorans]KID41647.1 ATPase YjeE, predicted to have essential role in cell wall biosynthesis [Fructilactobacillus fructivorans]MCT0151298.1 tRNA (adenosine(37)-N6)-threonylcarbamoyltransferase complex ATPase subunit type 1 TsaE [Fructilactobacillus fructivorans]MCT2867625.1 tRNA (adenosine(37)-N6)-threonylcarbamoyltransferase complex ATPase subunit type 1 TsaE [Fructilactobacillus f